MWRQIINVTDQHHVPWKGKAVRGLWTWLMLVWTVYLLLRCKSVCYWRQIYLIRQESTSWASLIGEEKKACARSLVTNQMCDDFATTKSHLEASRTFKTVHGHSWNIASVSFKATGQIIPPSCSMAFRLLFRQRGLSIMSTVISITTAFVPRIREPLWECCQLLSVSLLIMPSKPRKIITGWVWGVCRVVVRCAWTSFDFSISQ